MDLDFTSYAECLGVNSLHNNSFQKLPKTINFQLLLFQSGKQFGGLPEYQQSIIIQYCSVLEPLAMRCCKYLKCSPYLFLRNLNKCNGRKVAKQLKDCLFNFIKL